MKKLLSHPIIQWILMNIFLQEWVLMDKEDQRITAQSEKYHVVGDPTMSPTKWYTIRSLWRRQAIFRVCGGVDCYVGCDNAFGNRLVRLGRVYHSNETIFLGIGFEDVDFFLLTIDSVDPGRKPWLQLEGYEDFPR